MFTKTEHNQVPLLGRSAPFMEEIVVTKEGVTKLKELNPSKALGPDELHPRVLKELATELGPVFRPFATYFKVVRRKSERVPNARVGESTRGGNPPFVRGVGGSPPRIFLIYGCLYVRF